MNEFIIHVDAGHTPNGNPKRAYIRYSQTGLLLSVWDEGGAGCAAVPIEYQQAAYLCPKVTITTGQYREYMRWAKANM